MYRLFNFFFFDNMQNCKFRILTKLSAFTDHNTAKIMNKEIQYWAGINKYFKLNIGRVLFCRSWHQRYKYTDLYLK